MNDTDRLKIVKHMVESYMAGDFAPIAAAMSETIAIRLTVGPGTPLSGTFRGPEQVGEYFARNAEAVDTNEMKVLNYLAGGNQVAVTGRETLTIKKSGRVVKDSDWVMLCTFTDDKISEIVIIEDMTELANAYAVP